MTTATIGAHSRPAEARWANTRRTLAAWRRRSAGAATALWHRHGSPALTISGLTCIDASAYQVNLGIGLLVTGISGLVLGEWFGAG